MRVVKIDLLVKIDPSEHIFRRVTKCLKWPPNLFFTYLWRFGEALIYKPIVGRLANEGTALNGPQLTIYMHYTFAHLGQSGVEKTIGDTFRHFCALWRGQSENV